MSCPPSAAFSASHATSPCPAAALRESTIRMSVMPPSARNDSSPRRAALPLALNDSATVTHIADSATREAASYALMKSAGVGADVLAASPLRLSIP